MGSSAGGHLDSTLLTHFDKGDKDSTDVVEQQSSRPDLGILCYAVITMGDFTHHGSRENLLGKDPSPENIQLLSNELQVTSDTPPCFLWTTFEDTVVPLENTMMFASALRKNNVPFDLHIYQQGGHGMGLADKPPFAHPHPWAADCLYWLKVQNALPDADELGTLLKNLFACNGEVFNILEADEIHDGIRSRSECRPRRLQGYS